MTVELSFDRLVHAERSAALRALAPLLLLVPDEPRARRAAERYITALIDDTIEVLRWSDGVVTYFRGADQLLTRDADGTAELVTGEDVYTLRAGWRP